MWPRRRSVPGSRWRCSIRRPAIGPPGSGEWLAIRGRKARFVPALTWPWPMPERCTVHGFISWRGSYPRVLRRERAEAVFIDNLRWAAERLAGAGVTALIEPINPVDIPGYGLSSLEQAERVLAAVGHENLMLQYDFYHMAMTGVMLVENFRRLLPVIGHVQVADMPGRHEPGSGAVDYEAVFDAIGTSGYAGWVGAEYRPAAETSAGLDWMRGR